MNPTKQRGVRRRTKHEREAHYEYLRKLRLRGYTIKDMADKLDLSINQICLDIKVVKERALKTEQREYSELLKMEVGRLDDVMSEAWKAWERSIKDKVTKIIRQAKKSGQVIDGMFVEQRIAETAGDPRFLDVIVKTIIQRCALLGLPDSRPQQEDVERMSQALMGMYRSMAEREGLVPGPTGIAALEHQPESSQSH